MKFKVGDKVEYLNEKGGGIIKAIIDSKMVKLETKDGFEIPVLASDLILDFRFREQNESAISYRPADPLKAAEPIEEVEEFVTIINPYGKIREDEGIYLAFEPHDQQWVLTGELDVILINHTAYDVLYSLFMEIDGKITGIDYGSVPAHSKLTMASIERDEIEEWTKGFLQLLLHSDEPQKIYMPVHSVIDIRANRFYKEGSYQSNSMLQGKAMILNLAPLNSIQLASNTEQSQKYNTGTKAKIAEPVKEKAFIESYRTAMGEATIDLHIGAILDNILGLSSHDMFNIQVDHFKKALKSGIHEDYHKLTFIHGVGNGVLKNAIIKEIENYEGLENHMASISKFGVGAIDILITTKE